MKKIVIYFSRAGQNSVLNKIETIEKGYTQVLAEKIAKYANAHIFPLVPVKPYPSDYQECLERVKNETTVEYLHPEFKIDEYDVIFIGFPIWYRSYPRIVATFISNNKWDNKIVIPFCTNEEGAFGVADRELAGAVKGATMKLGFAEKGTEVNKVDNKIKAWLEEVLHE